MFLSCLFFLHPIFLVELAARNLMQMRRVECANKVTSILSLFLSRNGQVSSCDVCDEVIISHGLSRSSENKGPLPVDW